MARININSQLKNWADGQKMYANDFKKEREIIVTAINDNYNRIKDLENNIEINVPQEYSWEANEGQSEFVLPSGMKFPSIPKIVEVSMEGFDLTEGDEFEITNDNTTIEISQGVSAGTRVYAKWYEVRMLKLFTEDLQSYIIMGVF